MSITLLSGDCRDVLPTLAANSVHCVVTSPPYYGLRDYGTAQWDGGDAACDHRVWGHAAGKPTPGGRGGSMPAQEVVQREQCGKCGARRVDRQIGLEATPDEYLATMVAVMREVRRVLRPDGTLWLNIGDSYASGVGMARDQPYQRHAPQKSGLWKGTRSEKRDIGNNGVVKDGAGLKPKDLLLMPARLALALQADGWWVRSDIIWAKPNPMPESVTDRPTSAYEHVFLLTKSARYFWDAEAVREANTNPSLSECVTDWRERPGNGEWPSGTGGRMGSVQSGRNLRNVWTIATHAYPQAHFATYPPELAERCIRAGTSERGCCSACGAPWRRETTEPQVSGRRDHGGAAGGVDLGMWQGRAGSSLRDTTGWSPSCACAADVVPATVLDVFAGAGTTLLVADRLQRHAIGVELNASYTTMAMDRCRADAPLFADTPEPQPVPGFAQPDLFAEAAD